MLVTSITFKGHEYAGVVYPNFNGIRIYMKPCNAMSAVDAELNMGTSEAFAQATATKEQANFLDFAESDWVNSRYRLDIDSGLKVSSTCNNKYFTCSLAVAYSAAFNLVHSEKKRNSLGEYSRSWSESVDNPNLQATLTFEDSLLSKADITTADLEWHVWNVESSDADTLSPQLAIVYREATAKPVFNSLTKDAKILYTLVNAYAVLCNKEPEDLGIDAPKRTRTGYYSVNFNSKTMADIKCIDLMKSKVSKSPVNLGVYQTIEDVRDAYPDKNTGWIEDCRYEIVSDDMLDAVMKELWEYPIISFDTETTGLNINFLSRDGLADELVGVCLSGKEGTGYYIPVQHKLFANICNGDHRYFMQHYMKPLLETKDIICHNLSYDWKVAYIYDINVNCVFDTIIAFGVTKRYEYTDFPLGLKHICSKLFGIDMFEIEDFVIGEWKGSGITFADLPYELVRHYGPADADITLRVYNWCINNHLLENYSAQRVFSLEVNFSKVVAYSEFWGYHIDVSQIPALEQDIEDSMATEEAEIFRLAGEEFNIGSPAQLGRIMYDKCYPEIMQTGILSKRSTDKESLKELSDYRNPDGSPKYPIANHVFEWRKAQSTQKNFLKKKAEFISPDGYVFASVRQLGTNTGRVSINDPNYQSYNDVVKKRVTGRPGFYIFDCDFAQIEYRVLASMAGQDALIKAFDDPDLDYHTHQAARMFSLPYAAVSKQLRQQSKGINFGLPYGMGDESLGARVFGARNKENTAKAADLRKRFFAGQEKIQDFFTRVRAQGVKNGYTETWLGRRRYYHKEIFSEGAIRRQAGNHVIQGCLSGDTRIQLRDKGIVHIRDVVGLHTDVWDGRQWTTGDITYSGKKQKCVIHFKGTSQTFTCSPIHKFSIIGNFDKDSIPFEVDADMTWVTCENLQQDMHIECNLTTELSPFREDIRASCVGTNTPLVLCVDYVEITDEYIDMYDVCNTERGYYVADGLITHNTAADIWKLAVTRFFNRIVKEGLLGKVLFNCFVHDELMGEVSVDIDPYVFIKMWREEYELVIDKFCRLYAGFGWGNSWYEAKKADYPPQFIDTLVAKAGVDTSWDGDYKALIKKTKQALYDFETWRVVDWYQNATKGTLLAPHIGGYLYDKLADWWPDIIKEHPDYDNYLLKAKKGSEKPVATLDQAFQWFCEHEGIEYKPGWILPPDAKPDKTETNVIEASVPLDEEDEEAQRTRELEEEHLHFICQQVYSFGFFLDMTYSTLYLRYDTQALQNAINNIITNFAKADTSSDVKLVLMMYTPDGQAQAFAQNYSFALKDFASIQEIVRMAVATSA